MANILNGLGGLLKDLVSVSLALLAMLFLAIWLGAYLCTLGLYYRIFNGSWWL